MWDLGPWSGIEPGPPAVGAWSLNHCTTREVPWALFSLLHPDESQKKTKIGLEDHLYSLFQLQIPVITICVTQKDVGVWADAGSLTGRAKWLFMKINHKQSQLLDGLPQSISW